MRLRLELIPSLALLGLATAGCGGQHPVSRTDGAPRDSVLVDDGGAPIVAPCQAIGVQVPFDKPDVGEIWMKGHVNTTGLWVKWGDLDMNNNELVQEADRRVNLLRDAGLELRVHLQAAKGGIAKSPNPRQPFDDWVGAVVTRYRDRVHVWAVENEPCYGGAWSGTAAEYGAHLAATYDTIKAADPTALVTDGATTSTELQLLLAYEYWKANNKSDCDALVQYARANTGGELGQIDWDLYQSDPEGFFNQDKLRRCRGFTDEVRARKDKYDLIQLHWYGTGEWLEKCATSYVQWFADHSAAKRVEFWEVGTFIRAEEDLETAIGKVSGYIKEQLHLLSSHHLNARAVIYLPYVGKPVDRVRYHVGLVDKDNKPFATRQSFDEAVDLDWRECLSR